MRNEHTAPYGALLLRVGLGVMFLVHSLYLKLVVFTLPGTVKFYESIGLPGIGVGPHDRDVEREVDGDAAEQQGRGGVER